MRNEWKELEINNLPPDILTGDYDWEVMDYNGNWKMSKERRDRNIYSFLEWCSDCNLKYRYRKPEPKQPTHEEIIIKFWKTDQGFWLKPVGYCQGLYSLANTTFSSPVVNKARSWFTGHESADIPPE
jgi:hypothetical protein